MMASIRGKDTKPEITLRRGLHAMGFRFRLHWKDLPGRPDLVFPGRRAVLFAHGCFWHGHDCPLFRWPRTRGDFWRQKIGANVERDRRQVAQLLAEGWRVGIVWECALKGRGRLPPDDVLKGCADWLGSDRRELDIHGDWTGHAG